MDRAIFNLFFSLSFLVNIVLASEIVGKYKGAYSCPQGVTNLELDIFDNDLAIFRFSNKEELSFKFNGYYPLKIDYRDGTITAKTFKGIAPYMFVNEGTTFGDVGFNADFNLSTYEINGTIDFSSCGGINLKRVSDSNLFVGHYDAPQGNTISLINLYDDLNATWIFYRAFEFAGVTPVKFIFDESSLTIESLTEFKTAHSINNTVNWVSGNAILEKKDDSYEGEIRFFNNYNKRYDYFLKRVTQIGKNQEDKLKQSDIDALTAGWHLLGTSSEIDDFSIFENIDLIWKFDGDRWQVYANKGVGSFDKIEKNRGFWIKK